MVSGDRKGLKIVETTSIAMNKRNIFDFDLKILESMQTGLTTINQWYLKVNTKH